MINYNKVKGTIHATVCGLMSQGPFGWRSGKVKGWKISKRMENERIEKIWFSLMCIWLKGWKSERVENFFILLERKRRGWKM